MSAWSDRRLGPAHEPESGRSWLAIVLAAATLVAICAVSVRQLAAPATAQSLLGAGVAATVDIDGYLRDELPGLRSYFETSNERAVRLPGFPMEVVISREEVLGDEAVLREAVLQRSAALVYAEGLDAFDVTGSQSLPLFSWDTLLRLGVSQVNQGTHTRAGWVALFGAVVMVVCASGMLVSGAGGAFRRVGGALFVGALPGVIVAGGLLFLAGRLGSGSDSYTAELRPVIQAGFEIPFRNFAIVAAAGVLLGIWGVVAPRLDRLGSRETFSGLD